LIIDAHNHIGRRKGYEFPAEDLIGQMDEARIDKAVVFSFPERIDNGYIAASVSRFPDRLIGFCMVNPWDDGAEDELRRCILDLGLCGLKLHPVKHGYSLDDHIILDPVLSICREYRIPVIVHGAANILSCPNMLEDLALAFPDVTFIMAHSGQMYETRAAIGVAKRTPNVFLETSTVFAKTIGSQLKQLGPEKIIMGTDAPKGDFVLELEKIKSVVEDPDQFAMLTEGNIKKILQGKGGVRIDH